MLGNCESDKEKMQYYEVKTKSPHCLTKHVEKTNPKDGQRSRA